MAHLHSDEINLLHRDLKASNVVVTTDELFRFCAKICDFGISSCNIFSASAKDDKHYINNYLTTHAPECLRTGNISHPKSEVFAYGVILWEMLTLMSPIFCNDAGKERSEDEVREFVKLGGRLPLPSDEELSTETQQCRDYVELIRMCWRENLDDRPTFEQVILYIESKLQTQSKFLIRNPSAHNDLTRNFKEFDYFYDVKIPEPVEDSSSDSSSDMDTKYKQALQDIVV